MVPGGRCPGGRFDGFLLRLAAALSARAVPDARAATGQGFAYNAGRAIAAVGGGSTGVLMTQEVFNGSYAQAGAVISLVYVVGLVVLST